MSIGIWEKNIKDNSIPLIRPPVDAATSPQGKAVRGIVGVVSSKNQSPRWGGWFFVMCSILALKISTIALLHT